MGLLKIGFVNICNAYKIAFTALLSLSILVNMCYAQNEDHDGHVTFYIYHSLDSAASPTYSFRGTISVYSLKQGVFQQDGLMSSQDIFMLKKLAKEGGLYRLKAESKSGDVITSTVSTFMKACALYESGLSDSITLTVDQAGTLLGVAIAAKSSQCEGNHISDGQLSTFNTSVTVISPMTGPVPDTQTYVQRIEQEKAEKARGEQGDNRSFLAKYWMYIVPLLIFLLVSGASGPEGQTNGR